MDITHYRYKLRKEIDYSIEHTLGVKLPDVANKIATTALYKILLLPEYIAFKDAKREARKNHLTELLHVTSGNVSEASQLAGISRRQFHRLAKEFNINASAVREQNNSTYAVRHHLLEEALDKALQPYKKVLHPQAIEKIKESDLVQRMLAETNEIKPLPLKELDALVNEQVSEQARKMTQYKSITQLAQELKMRRETLSRKLRRAA